MGLRYTAASLKVMLIVIESLKPNEKEIFNDMTPELFATHKAFAMVKDGKSFRDAYMEVGANLDKISIDKKEILKMLKESRHQGGTGNLQLNKLKQEIKKLQSM